MAGAEPPAAVQNKFSPYHPGDMHNGPGDDYVKLVGKAGAALVGYCPLSAWPSALSAVKDPHIAEIAARVGRSPAQARAAAT